jgi:homoserine dehydrogenase
MKLAVMGVGAVGASVVELAGEYGHDVVAVADSSTAAADADGRDRKSVG